MITKDQVKALLEAEEKATPAGWDTIINLELKQIIVRCDTPKYGGSDYIAEVNWAGQQCHDDKIANAELIVIMRNNIRALCKSWLEQQEKIALLEVKRFEHRDVLINRAEAAEFKLTQTQDALELACEALDFYADKNNWDDDKFNPSIWNSDGSIDLGRAAHEALADPIIQAARRKKTK